MSKVEQIFAQHGLESLDTDMTFIDFINSKIATLSAEFINILPWMVSLAVLYLGVSLLFSLGNKDKIEKVKSSAGFIFLGFALAIFAVTIVNLAIKIPELITQ